jgi:hypothetical protein
MSTARAANCQCLKALKAAADVGDETWQMVVNKALDCYALSPVAECRDVPGAVRDGRVKAQPLGFDAVVANCASL